MTVSYITGFEDFGPKPERPTIVTVGTFDGVHVGHQEILRLMTAQAREELDTVLVTFDPHPRSVVRPSDAPQLLTTLAEKKKILADFFDGKVLILRFDDGLRRMSAEQFVRDILIERLNMRQLIVGYDHGFGRDRGGSTVELSHMGRSLGFDFDIVKPVAVGGTLVSSSAIRKAMCDGAFDRALKLLGHPYAIAGRVEKGIGLGCKLGYPTANMAYAENKLLPADGVYSCRVQVAEEIHRGMMFIGRNYFNPELRRTVEVNVFDLDRDLYGQELTVWPLAYVRANRKFEATEDLVAQIGEDKKLVLDMFQKE